MKAKKQVIFISGYGNYHWLNVSFACFWRLFGYRAQVFEFQWEQPHYLLAKKQAALLAMIDEVPMEPMLFLIGISAGGTAAVNAFAERRQRISKIATVSSPYAWREVRETLLDISAAQAHDHLAAFDVPTKQRILSLFAKRDLIVPPHMSQPVGIALRKIPAMSHAASVVLGPTRYSSIIRRFFSA